MKAKSRRRLLISSVAMLLVAMLALGTATFAWFTKSTEATANDINVIASKASSLEISKSDHHWTTSFSYGLGTTTDKKKFIPTTSADGINWFTADADTSNAFTAKTGTIKEASVTYASTAGNYAFVDQLNIKNTGTAGDITNVQIAVSFKEGSQTSSFARIALVPCSETAAGTKGTEAENAFKSHVYAKTADTTGVDAFKATDGSTTPVPSKVWTSLDITDTTLAYTTTLAPGKAQYYNLYVWFEGQDSDCTDATVGEVLDSLKFTVTGTAA